MKTASIILDLMSESINGYSWSNGVFECDGVKIMCSYNLFQLCVDFYKAVGKETYYGI